MLALISGGNATAKTCYPYLEKLRYPRTVVSGNIVPVAVKFGNTLGMIHLDKILYFSTQLTFHGWAAATLTWQGSPGIKPS